MPPETNPVPPSPPTPELPPAIPEQESSAFFTRAQLVGLYVSLGCFAISSVAAALAPVTSNVSNILLIAWFVGVAAGLGTVVASFLGGVVNIFQDKGVMLASSFVIGFIVVIVGYGSCAFNISGMQ
jgi:hypothetical protein